MVLIGSVNRLLNVEFIETINEIIKAYYLLTDSMQYQMAQVACLFSLAACSPLTKLTETLKSTHYFKSLLAEIIDICRNRYYSKIIPKRIK